MTAPRHERSADDAPQGELAGWGRQAVRGTEILSEDLESITQGAVISRGLGRSYGDSSLPPPGEPRAVNTTLADRILSFDASTGMLRAEAGLSLLRLNRIFLARGWFSPVTPGTQYVTLGGMVAADVHGKNHHVAGCFGQHVRRLRLRVADGRIVECGPQIEPELFWATVAGMGLTGHILEVEFALERIPSPWIWQESERVSDIDAYIQALGVAARDWPYTVGWIDCLTQGAGMGRGILIKGRWATADEAPVRAPEPRRRVSVPFVVPGFVMSRATVQAFNTVNYWQHFRAKRSGIAHPEDFFYPLDKGLHWNRLYGPQGLTQFQCVIPKHDCAAGARRILDILTESGGASFLCIIKDCGPEGQGLLSFPREGISIALDLPVRPQTPALITRLNAQVLAQGGRIYLAKDAYTTEQEFRQMEPRLPAFERVRRAWDPELRIRSAQSVRVLGDHP